VWVGRQFVGPEYKQQCRSQRKPRTSRTRCSPKWPVAFLASRSCCRVAKAVALFIPRAMLVSAPTRPAATTRKEVFPRHPAALRASTGSTNP